MCFFKFVWSTKLYFKPIHSTVARTARKTQKRKLYHFKLSLSRRSRQRRAVMGIANRTHTFLTTAPSPPQGTDVPVDEDGETFESTKTVVTVHAKESTVISNLRHFTSYQIEVHACNHPTDPARCSMAAYVSARTMPEGKETR